MLKLNENLVNDQPNLINMNFLEEIQEFVTNQLFVS